MQPTESASDREHAPRGRALVEVMALNTPSCNAWPCEFLHYLPTYHFADHVIRPNRAKVHKPSFGRSLTHSSVKMKSTRATCPPGLTALATSRVMCSRWRDNRQSALSATPSHPREFACRLSVLSSLPRENAYPILIVARASKPRCANRRALPTSHGLAMMNAPSRS